MRSITLVFPVFFVFLYYSGDRPLLQLVKAGKLKEISGKQNHPSSQVGEVLQTRMYRGCRGKGERREGFLLRRSRYKRCLFAFRPCVAQMPQTWILWAQRFDRELCYHTALGELSPLGDDVSGKKKITWIEKAKAIWALWWESCVCVLVRLRTIQRHPRVTFKGFPE